jgi:diaminopimelate epimerase
MFNTDGSEDFCGNGLRCAATYAFQKGWTGLETLIKHYGRTVETSILPDGQVRSVVPAADFRPEAVPLASASELFMTPVEILGTNQMLSAVSTGSTHTVILSDHLPDDEVLRTLGPAIEHHPLFPIRTSVIWAVPEANDRIRIRIWERGVGETLGCGTGSAAVAAVYARYAERPSLYCVINPGGEVLVSVTDLGAPIITTARAEILYAGSYGKN